MPGFDFGFDFGIATLRRRSDPFIPVGAIVVSAAAYGSLPIGDDAAGNGTKAAPYATLAKALTVASDGAQIVLNGNPAAPSIYTAATFFSITKGVKIDAVWPYGAILQGTGAQTRVLNLAPTTGQTVSLGKITIDATGTIGSCVLISDQAMTYTVNANGTKFLNWTTQGFAATASATATKVNAALNGCIFSADNTRSAIYFKALSAGIVSVSNCKIDITNQNKAGHGGVIIWANAAGVGASVTGSTINVSLNTTTGTSTTYGVQLFNMPNVVVSGNKFSVSSAVAARPVETIQVCANSTAPRDSSGATVIGNTINHDANGGMCIEIGEDNQDSGSRGYQNGALVADNVVTCSTLSRSATTHGLFNGSGSNTIFRRNVVKQAGIGIGDKEGDGVLSFDNILVDAGNSFLRIKGAANSAHRQNTIVKTQAGGTPILVSNNSTNSHSGSANVVSGNLFYSSVATTWINDAGTEGLTYDHNDYFSSAGLSANPWSFGGTNYANLTTWQGSKEPSAIAVDPQFVDAASGNYDVSAAGIDVVPFNVKAQADYLGRAFRSPGSAGAFQRAVVGGDWSTVDFDAAKATFSNSNRTVARTGDDLTIASADGVTTGKRYVEITIDQNEYGDLSIHNHDDSRYVHLAWDGQTWSSRDGNLYGQITAFVAGQTVRLAYDADNPTVWFAVESGPWNGNANADPATNIGGFAMPLDPHEPAFVKVAMWYFNGSQRTLNTGTAPFKFEIPTGFSPFKR